MKGGGDGNDFSDINTVTGHRTDRKRVVPGHY